MTKLEKVLYDTFILFIAALAVAGVFLMGVIVVMMMMGVQIPNYLVVITWVLSPALYIIGGVVIVSGIGVGLARLIRSSHEFCCVCRERMPVVFERNRFGDPICGKPNCVIMSLLSGLSEDPEEIRKALDEQERGDGPKFIQA